MYVFVLCKNLLWQRFVYTKNKINFVQIFVKNLETYHVYGNSRNRYTVNSVYVEIAMNRKKQGDSIIFIKNLNLGI